MSTAVYVLPELNAQLRHFLREPGLCELAMREASALEAQWLVSDSVNCPATRPICARSTRVRTQSSVLP
jgi:hypothetical protein